MRELKIADVTSILINTKIENYKKHAGILANTFPDKKHKTGILIKRFGVFHRIFLQALLERQDTKIEIQKNMPALGLAHFQKKKRLKRKSLQTYSCISRNIFAGIVGLA